MDFIKSGLLASLPFLAAFIGVLCSGFFSDFLIRRGYTVGFAHKLPIISGLLISTSIIDANFVESTPLVIAFLATGDSFAPAIIYISVLALIGALSYILLVGKVERIKL